MKGAKRILRAGLLLALLPAAGCLSQHRSAVADVDPLGWREAAEVRFPNADTLAVCDLWLVVRYDAAFAGGPVDLEVTTVAPDSLRATLRCAGDYRMTIRPCRPVRGIEAVGVTIEKSI